MANILPNLLQMLTPALVSKTRPGGRTTLSDVLARQAKGVIATIVRSGSHFSHGKKVMTVMSAYITSYQ